MECRFSRRTAWDLAEGELARALRERREAGLPVFDLTVSNPTVCGFDYDVDATLQALSHPAAMRYDPAPGGIHSAREAVAHYYFKHHAKVNAEALVLTTSTSEAYSYLFRLLCDADDEVLVAQPSYPLFDFLAVLDDVRLASYPLFYDFGWWIDFAELERRIGPRTRAVLLVHPNNPTGHATRAAERQRLEEMCARHGLALIVDEVFLDYVLEAEPIGSFAAGAHACLTFVVSGLSKIAALPQMKVGWIATFGPADVRREALNRLEMIADTFLSLNAPAQHALPAWLAGRERVAAQIRERVRGNLAELERLGLEFLPVEAGWSAVLRLAGLGLGSKEEELALRLVREVGVVTHPGSFYGMPERNRLVVSLLGEEFVEGAGKLKEWFESNKLTARIDG
jgi:aspartate/methionine/tyrosine aminotransferase